MFLPYRERRSKDVKVLKNRLMWEFCLPPGDICLLVLYYCQGPCLGPWPNFRNSPTWCPWALYHQGWKGNWSHGCHKWPWGQRAMPPQRLPDYPGLNILGCHLGQWNHKGLSWCQWSCLRLWPYCSPGLYLYQWLLLHGKARPTPHYRTGRACSAPHLRRMVVVIWTDQLSCTQTHTQVLELAHPNIYPIYDLLECLKGPILKTIAAQNLSLGQ